MEHCDILWLLSRMQAYGTSLIFSLYLSLAPSLSIQYSIPVLLPSGIPLPFYSLCSLRSSKYCTAHATVCPNPSPQLLLNIYLPILLSINLSTASYKTITVFWTKIFSHSQALCLIHSIYKDHFPSSKKKRKRKNPLTFVLTGPIVPTPPHFPLPSLVFFSFAHSIHASPYCPSWYFTITFSSTS